MAETTRKVDIFECLNHIDRKDRHFFKNLSNESKPGFQPVVVMRWVYGSPHPLQHILLNIAVNKYLFALSSHHPDLVYRLLTTTAVKSKTSYKWIPKSAKVTTYPLSLQAISDALNISLRESELHLRQFDSNDILALATAAGWQPDEIKKLKAERK